MHATRRPTSIVFFAVEYGQLRNRSSSAEGHCTTLSFKNSTTSPASSRGWIATRLWPSLGTLRNCPRRFRNRPRSQRFSNDSMAIVRVAGDDSRPLDCVSLRATVRNSARVFRTVAKSEASVSRSTSVYTARANSPSRDGQDPPRAPMALRGSHGCG
jgi:hypothetical protein